MFRHDYERGGELTSDGEVGLSILDDGILQDFGEVCPNVTIFARKGIVMRREREEGMAHVVGGDTEYLSTTLRCYNLNC